MLGHASYGLIPLCLLGMSLRELDRKKGEKKAIKLQNSKIKI